jgi:phospholipid/cholesterol/gamma-HCH transport system substrate-binding protein
MFKFSNETKVGLLAAIAIFLGIWGYKFLKGTNLLTSSQTFYVRYDNVDQLRPSNPIFISGLQVGMIKDIYVDNEDDKTLVCVLNIDKGVDIPKDATAAIIGLTLMGGKAIEIVITRPCEGDCAPSGSWLKGETRSLARSLLGDPTQLDAYASRVRMAFDSIANPNDPNGLGPTLKSLEQSLAGVAEITRRVNALLAASTAGISATTNNAAAITNALKNNNDDITATINNLKEVSNQLKGAGMDQTVKSINTAIAEMENSLKTLQATIATAQTAIGQVDTLARGLSEGKGSLGLLLTDDQLYNNLNLTLFEAGVASTKIRSSRLLGRNRQVKNPFKDPAYGIWVDSMQQHYTGKIKVKQ